VVVILESGKGLKGGVETGLKFFYKRNATHRWAENFAGAVSHVSMGVPGFLRVCFFYFSSTLDSDKIATGIKLFFR
jgi:hypothetical protein